MGEDWSSDNNFSSSVRRAAVIRRFSNGYLKWSTGSAAGNYAPTLALTTLGITCAAALGDKPEQADVETSFLLAELPEGEEVYVLPPKHWLPRRISVCYTASANLLAGDTTRSIVNREIMRLRRKNIRVRQENGKML